MIGSWAVTVRVMAKLLALLCVFVLAACGGATEQKEEPDPGQAWKAAYPDCKGIWQVGKYLPADYERGCLYNGETLADNVYTPCSDGKTRLFVHRTPAGKTTHIAITGSVIRAYDGKARSAAFKECVRPAE